ncbi:MAG: hypothetical protein H0T48_07685 [Gemmatimonadaceae bacterium]|nr:hypothetical protein [Gemmatimonadaceae bacterium]
MPDVDERKYATFVTGGAPRIAVSMVVGALAGLFLLATESQTRGASTDFNLTWLAAKAVLAGQNPYELIGPGKLHPEGGYPYIYPLTAAVFALPLALIPSYWATALFVSIGAGLLAFAVTKDGWRRLPLFLSMPYIIAARQGQWSPLLSAAFCIPALAGVLSAKPTLGFALLAAAGSRRTLVFAVVGGLFLTTVGLVLVPTWPLDWFQTLTATRHLRAPVLQPGGFVALLALLRWRRPEARLIALLACVPQTVGWYEVVPLFLVAVTFRETLILAILSSMPVLYEVWYGAADGFFDFTPRGFQMAAFAYMPAVALVLLRKNEWREASHYH